MFSSAFPALLVAFSELNSCFLCIVILSFPMGRSVDGEPYFSVNGLEARDCFNWTLPCVFDRSPWEKRISGSSQRTQRDVIVFIIS